MFRNIFAVSIGIVLTVSLVAPFDARQTATRVSGTITAIEGDHIQIKDQAGKPVIVMLQKTTRYLKSEKGATKAELKVGTRVVIEVRMDDQMKMLAAEEVTISTNDARPGPSETDSTKAR